MRTKLIRKSLMAMLVIAGALMVAFVFMQKPASAATMKMLKSKHIKYYKNGLVKQLDGNNNFVGTFEYDSKGRITKVCQYNGSVKKSKLETAYRFSYDSKGNIKGAAVDEYDGGKVSAWFPCKHQQDKKKRLTMLTYKDDKEEYEFKDTWAYNSKGRVKSWTQKGSERGRQIMTFKSTVKWSDKGYVKSVSTQENYYGDKDSYTDKYQYSSKKGRVTAIKWISADGPTTWRFGYKKMSYKKKFKTIIQRQQKDLLYVYCAEKAMDPYFQLAFEN